MNESQTAIPIKTPGSLSPRVAWLRDYYFQGTRRAWNNEYTSWTTGTDWDQQFQELTYHIVPEVYPLLSAMAGSYRQSARPVPLPEGFWGLSRVERRAIFLKEVLVRHLPAEILPGDLLAGARFNVQISLCLSKQEAREYEKRTAGPGGVREQVVRFHRHGYGNAGATSGHLIPGHEALLRGGFKAVHEDLLSRLNELSPRQRAGRRGNQLRAMLTASTIARDLARRYADVCRTQASKESDPARRQELSTMASQLDRVPWEPPRTFWEALQALWIGHMLILADENYPGAGVSFGRIDQYLLPYWQTSVEEGMSRDFAKELLGCFWFHCNTAYDAQIRTGNQGITAGFGQLLTLSGLDNDGRDATNDLTWLFLEVIDEMSPILEPKPNVRLHRTSPDALLDKVVDMVASSQGAPFLLNFDERSAAGMLRQGRLGNLSSLIHRDNVMDYAPVGCLENTMVGNDRSGTVDANLNLTKAVELALGSGKGLIPAKDPISGKTEPIRQDGPYTGDPRRFQTFDEFWQAFRRQMAHIVTETARLYERSEQIRCDFFQTPYLSCMVKGCAESGKDITEGGSEIRLVTLEGVTFATTVDSLLAIRYLVFDEKLCSMDQLIQALRDNWVGHEVLQARARFKAPKYGCDNDAADGVAAAVMECFAHETWKHRTRCTDRQFRPGMLSWNYWAGDGYIVCATPNGRRQGEFLSNAICPSNGADINGPTANTNSVGKSLGGRTGNASSGDFEDYVNLLPNGASHTITFHPGLLNDPEHKARFKAFLRGYCENGGTALQVNILDPAVLKDAQKHPQDYRHLLVRITGYNAYFTSIGRELQDEVIARLSHRCV